MSQPYEPWIERQIRQAAERGEFSGLRGSGRPLDLGAPDDPDWWVRRKLAREGLDLSALVPPVIALRREAAGYPESLTDVATAEEVREILRDYNRRMIADRRTPASGRAMPAVAPRIDVEAMVARWQAMHDERAADTGPPPEPLPEGKCRHPRPRWWHRFARRSSRAEQVARGRP